MNKNFNWLQRVKEPRIAMRGLIGVLVVANLAAAVAAFHPFGGSASDLRQQDASLRARLAAVQAHAAIGKRLVEKAEAARRDGDAFLEKYVVDRQSSSSAIYDELMKMARESGIKALGINDQYDQIEGGDTIEMLTIQAGYEGTYDKLAKFVNLVDKSPRFLIIENMNLAAPSQAGQVLSVQFKLHTFVREGAREQQETPQTAKSQL